jgi:putative membrane protein
MKRFKILFDGIVMGIAEIVPGVSASTATLLLGIYDDFLNLLESVTNFIRDLLNFILGKTTKVNLIKSFSRIKFAYGIQLFIGMVIGVVLFSNIVDYFYENNQSVVQAVFFGIILASIAIPIKIVKKPKLSDILFLVIGFLAFLAVIRMGQVSDAESIPLWLIFLGGTISVSGMVLPGVNSSFILIPLGIYELILKIVKEFSRLNFSMELISQALIFALGVGFGLITFVKVLKYAFKNHITKLFSLIAGIMVASLISLWPYHEVDYMSGASMTVSVILLLSFILTLVFILKTKPEEEVTLNR